MPDLSLCRPVFDRDPVRYLDMTLDVVGAENLPKKNDGKLYTFVSNHPLGGADGVALGSIIGQHYDGNLRFHNIKTYIYEKKYYFFCFFCYINKLFG